LGRKRIHPLDATPTDRVNASVAALKKRGGSRKTWRLSPQATAALRTIRALTRAPTETAVVERLLLEERARLELNCRPGRSS
jgi:hypothetical protein